MRRVRTLGGLAYLCTRVGCGGQYASILLNITAGQPNPPASVRSRSRSLRWPQSHHWRYCCCRPPQPGGHEFQDGDSCFCVCVPVCEFALCGAHSLHIEAYHRATFAPRTGCCPPPPRPLAEGSSQEITSSDPQLSFGPFHPSRRRSILFVAVYKCCAHAFQE
jgi:hypothetical protein